MQLNHHHYNTYGKLPISTTMIIGKWVGSKTLDTARYGGGANSPNTKKL